MKKIVVIGGLNHDLVAMADSIPAVGETVFAEYGGQFRGGKGANQAVTIAKLGGYVEMLGTVGADTAGEFLLEGLSEVGVSKEHINVVSNMPTGQAWIAINRRGDNSIIILSGANQYTSIEYIETKRSVIENADIVLMQLEVPLETVCYVAKMAKELGKIFILDPAPAIENIPDQLLANIDYMKPNETELATMTGCANKFQDGALQLANRGAKNIVVSLAEKGVYCRAVNGSIIEKPARKVDVVDTTAAGDGFIGAFALGLAKNKSVEEAIAFAQTVASIVVTRLGAQASLPSIAEINECIL